MTAERLVHHELCFGCGRTNLFGLLMELERTAEGGVRGRGFIKQDHQGAVRGIAHDGIVAAALSEAMAFAAGTVGGAAEITLQLAAPVPVGTFLEVEASVLVAGDDELKVTSTAAVEGRHVASGGGIYRRS